MTIARLRQIFQEEETRIRKDASLSKEERRWALVEFKHLTEAVFKAHEQVLD